MKKILLATTLIAGLSVSAAMADDFDNNGVNLTLERDNLTFGLETVAGEATALTFGVTVLPHDLMGAVADVTLGVDYGIESEDFTLKASYGVSQSYGQVNVYTDLEAAYTVASGDTDGVWEATPTVGVAYVVNAQLTTYGEVAYTWDATNDWSREGGTVELGARYALSSDVALSPSLTRSFDTSDDETNLNLEVALQF